MSSVQLSTGATALNVNNAGASGALSVQTNTSNALFVDANGNVGIGTTVPLSKLGILGDILIDNDTGTGVEGSLLGNVLFRGRWWDGTVGRVIQGGIRNIKTQGNGYFGGGIQLCSTNGTEVLNPVLTTTHLGYVGIGKTNPATALDVNGIVKNLNPVFSASRTAGYITQGNVFVFNAANTNVGNHYNTSNGRFTAPISGNYMFSLFAIREGSGIAHIEIRKNGTLVNTFAPYSRIDGGGVYYQGVSGTAIVALNAGDYVDAYATEGSFYGYNHNQFCGCLLG